MTMKLVQQREVGRLRFGWHEGNYAIGLRYDLEREPIEVKLEEVEALIQALRSFQHSAMWWADAEDRRELSYAKCENCEELTFYPELVRTEGGFLLCEKCFRDTSEGKRNEREDAEVRKAGV